MWYTVDFYKLVVLLTPTFLRKPKLIGYLQALIAPIDGLYYKWWLFRNTNLYKLTHTGQVCSLQKSLNDTFDSIFRRIYIGNMLEHKPFYLFTEAERQPAWLHTEPENSPIWLYTDIETAYGSFYFIVYVPQEVFDTELFSLQAHLDFYKAGGTHYKILVLN